jgi:phosphate-selective porin OprO/OprP
LTAAQSPPLPKPAASTAADDAEPRESARHSREAELEDEVRELKTMVKQLSMRVEQLSQDLVSRTVPAAGESGGTSPSGGAGGLSGGTSSARGSMAGSGGDGSARGGGTLGPQEASASSGGSAAARGPLEPRRSTRFEMPGVSPDFPVKGIFGPGFQLQTEDAEFLLQFHNLTQVDGRFYTQGGQMPVASTFLLPREWLIFSGRLTRPFEYYVSAAEGIDNLNVLDVYLNVDFDERLQFKIGRYKTPFTYEFYGLTINSFITPERSLFFNNFGLNRDLGMMAWGTLFDSRFDYAAGIFNGTRNGYVDTNDFKDFAGLVNFKPFVNWTDSWLENLNFGGSTDTGLQNNVPVPKVFRTNVATTGNLAIGPEFLALNNNVVESGLRAFWSLYMAYYYQHLSLIAEWESGLDSFGFVNQKPHTRLPVESFYVMAAYFLTGETVSGRGILKPLRNFDVRKGKFGLGALELVARYNYLNIGRQIFTGGFADPNQWTNQLYTVDVGVNWYWTQFVKVYLGWQHAGFGDPVLFAPGRFQSASDQFWLRFQVYF